MKFSKKFLIAILGFALFTQIFSCKENIINDIKEQSKTKDIEELVIDNNFDWSLTRDVEANIGIYENMDSKTGLPFVVVELSDMSTDNILFKGVTDESGKLSTSFTIPTSSSYILVSTSFKDTIVPVLNNQINCEFATEWVNLNGTLQSNKMSYRRAASNLLTNGDFELKTYDSTNSYYDSKQGLDTWLVMKGDGKKKVYGFPTTENSNGVFKLQNEKSSAYVLQNIDGISGGKKYTFSVSGKIVKNKDDDNDFVAYLMFYSKLNTSLEAAYYFNEFDTKWETKSATVTAPKDAAYAKVLLYISNKAKKNSVILWDDITLEVQGDKDNDGVDDSQDDYPEDNTKAFNNYYPSSSKYATLAFEDLWPGKGDYDFNDLIIDYRYNSITNKDNKVVQLDCDFQVRAIGAGYHNGFGIQLNVKPNVVSNITGQTLVHSYLSFSSNKTESNQNKAVIIFFDDAFAITNHPGGSTKYVNTVSTETYVTPGKKTISVTFTTPQTKDALGSIPYNPFLIIDGTRGRELHLPNYAPTDLADSKYFGTIDDNSDATKSRYYVTSNTLPWALNIPSQFDYPLEKTKITSSYLKFGSWATSNGTTYTDWYDSKSGYRDSKKIYSH